MQVSNVINMNLICVSYEFSMHFVSGPYKILQNLSHEVQVNFVWKVYMTLRWRHNGRDSISNHQPHDCLLNRLFRHRSKKTWKLRVTGLCAGNSPVTGEFPAQMASNAENVSIWWRRHEIHEAHAMYMNESQGPSSIRSYGCTDVWQARIQYRRDRIISFILPIWIGNYIHHKCGIKLLIHSQTSTIKPLKFGNR